MSTDTKPPADIDKLRRLVARLRAPDGCPWDRQQTARDLRAYVLEEAHEVAAAIDEGDPAALCDELGDLLFQVVFLSQIGEEDGTFDLAAVIDAIHHKMVERHPHVFGDAATLADADSVRRAWERRKLETGDGRSLLAGVPSSLPALTGAYRMTQKVAGVGFDWPDVAAVLDKIREELAEVEEAIDHRQTTPDPAVDEEIGDLLFAIVNLARRLRLDPEASLAQANRKFRRRFETMTGVLRKSVAEATPEELDDAWEEAKRRERAS